MPGGASRTTRGRSAGPLGGSRPPARPRPAGQGRSCGCAARAAFSRLLRSAVVVRSGPRPEGPDSAWHDGRYRHGGARGHRVRRSALAAPRRPHGWSPIVAGSGRPSGAGVAMAAVLLGLRRGQLEGIQRGPARPRDRQRCPHGLCPAGSCLCRLGRAEPRGRG